jgi:ribosomal protein L11 methylase PrmA
MSDSSDLIRQCRQWFRVACVAVAPRYRITIPILLLIPLRTFTHRDQILDLDVDFGFAFGFGSHQGKEICVDILQKVLEEPLGFFLEKSAKLKVNMIDII